MWTGRFILHRGAFGGSLKGIYGRHLEGHLGPIWSLIWSLFGVHLKPPPLFLFYFILFYLFGPPFGALAPFRALLESL